MGYPSGSLECHLCPKSFETRGKLNRHLKQHTKPYHCPHIGCNQSFGLKADLDRHQRRHQITAGKFLCHVSDCTFKGATRKDNLRRHMRTCHEPETEIEKLCKKAQSDREILIDSSSLLQIAEAGHEKVLQWLIDHDANVTITTDTGKSALHVAARNGNIPCMEVLLDAGADIHARDHQGNSVLHDAVYCAQENATQFLIDRHAALSALNILGNTILHESILSGNIAITRLLLQNDIEVNVANLEDKTPLYIAIKRGEIEVVKLLLEKGANHEYREGNTVSPIIVARRNHNDQLVEILERQKVSSGEIKRVRELVSVAAKGDEAAANSLFSDGLYPDSFSANTGGLLYYAVEQENIPVIRLLLAHKAKVWRDGFYNPLEKAVKRNLEPVLRLFLEYELDNKCLSQALVFAVQANNENIVRILVQHCEDSQPHAGDDALWEAALRSSENLVRMLLKLRANRDPYCAEMLSQLEVQGDCEKLLYILFRYGIPAGTKSGTQACVWAAGEGHEELVRLFLEGGVDPDCTVEYGWKESALQAAARNGHEGIGRLLLQYGASVNKMNPWSSNTAMTSAVERGHENFVNLLLEHGASVSTATNASQNDIIPRAIYYGGKNSLVRTLLEHGASVHGQVVGQTALCIAVREKNIAMVRILIEFGADIDRECEDIQVAARRMLENDQVGSS